MTTIIIRTPATTTIAIIASILLILEGRLFKGLVVFFSVVEEEVVVVGGEVGGAVVVEVSFEVSVSVEVGEQLGKGAYGIVRKATFQNQQVAVKELSNETISTKAQEEFAEEVLVLKKIGKHKNILAVIGFVETPQCIVTEFYPNGSVDNYLSKNKLSDEKKNSYCKRSLCWNDISW